MKKSLLFLVSAFCISHLAFAQLQPMLDSIPMRDGKTLAADVYLPNSGTQALPTILIQTPYNRLYYRLGLPLGIGTNINSSNYNVVILDWRCFYGSTAACVTTPNRGQDGYDVVEWIAQQSWSNGKIGTWGPSALGRIQFLTAEEHPPHLVCINPLVAAPQYEYLEYYPGGVYRTEYVQTLDALGFGLSTTILAHTVYDLYWQFVENVTFTPQAIAVPTFMIGGWYDHAVEPMLKFFPALRQQSAISVRNSHRLLMGPWTHSATSSSPAQVGQLTYNAAKGWSDSLSMKFFDYHLRNIANNWNLSPYVQYFQMGENTWRSDTAWYTGNIQNVNLYFYKDGSLSPLFPTAFSDYQDIIYDPRNPSPTVGGPTLAPTLNQGPYDQAPVVESRNDILTFTTDPLPQDVVLRGKTKVHLVVSSDRPDTDFSIRLTDVYPDGRSMLLLDGIRRMRFRNGYTAADTSAIIPAQYYTLEIDLFNTAITFLAGHRIRVDVTSSNYPRFDKNLNNDDKMYVAGDTLVATNSVHMNSSFASYITLPVLSFPSAVGKINSEEKFSFYPNPASDFLYLKFSDNGKHLIKILSAEGRSVQEFSSTGTEAKISLQDLSGGLYWITISDKEFVSTKKFVILK